MKRRLRTSAVVLILALGNMTTILARADNENDARAAVRRGLEAMNRGDAEDALTEYESAKRLAPTANAPWFYAAAALDKLGRWREAVDNLETYLAKDPSVSDAAEVKARIAKLRAEHFPARMHVTVTGAAEASVSVNDLALESQRSPATFELSPGSHQLEGRAPGYQPTKRTIVVVGDTESTVELVLMPVPAAPDTRVPSPASAPEIASGWRTVGIVAAAVGAATVISAVVIDAAVLGPKIDEFNTAAGRFDPSARDLRSEAEGLRTLTIVGYATGAVLLAGGLALALLSPRSAARSARAITTGLRWTF